MDAEDVWGSKHNEINWISILEKLINLLRGYTCQYVIHFLLAILRRFVYQALKLKKLDLSNLNYIHHSPYSTFKEKKHKTKQEHSQVLSSQWL